MRGNQRALHITEIPVIILALTLLIFTPITGQRFDKESIGKHSRKVRIVGGTPAAQENNKHQASIRMRHIDDQSYGLGHGCSGSLISPRVVLSAAHCYVDLNPFGLIVVMGNSDRYEKTHTLCIELDDLVMHPEFNNNTAQHDIALLFLAGSVSDDNEYVQPIEINRQPVQEITKCQVTGWGATERRQSTNAKSSSRLLAVDIVAIPFAICKNLLENRMHPGMLCAGDILDWAKGSCYGDSGGPLVCHGLLVGIVSHGLSKTCAPTGLPAIYTAVDYYEDWIDKEMRKPHRKKNGSVKVSFTVILVIGSIFSSWM